jgi:glutathione S-transferase
MISVPVSPYVELARWALERLEVPYVEQGHVPMVHLLATRTHGGGVAVPVIGTGGVVLKDAREVFDHYEQEAPERLRLYPSDPGERGVAKALFDRCFDELAVAVRAWAYAYMLPCRASTSRVWRVGVPRVERLVVDVGYPVLAMALSRALHLGPDSVATERAAIEAFLDQIGVRLGDGRRYLCGDRFTAADLAFASMVAPAVIPPEYGGPMPGLDEMPPAMVAEVERFRGHPAGEFALRVYREDRS